jgi:hypothetical protein
MFGLSRTRGPDPRRLRARSACAAALLCGCLGLSAPAGAAQSGQTSATGQDPSVSATLEQCVAASAQSERSAMFAGEMTSLAGSVRMAIRIEIQEEISGEATFHTITAPGLDGWRVSDPGVKAYKFNKQVSNLFAPAVYRATVRFRWLNTKGHLMKSAMRHTPRCRQPAASPLPTSAT